LKHRILISASGTGTAFAIISRLRAVWGDAVEIFSTDVNPSHLVTSSVFVDRHFQVLPASDPGYLKSITTIIDEHAIDTYVPLLNAEIFLGLDIAKRFPQCDIWTSELTASLSTSKREASQWLKGLGVAVPDTLSNPEIDPEHEYFIKPDDGFGSVGARRIVGKDALELNTASNLVQPICSVPEITVDSFYDNSTGFCRAICRKRIEVKSGVCTKALVFENEELSLIAEKIGRGLAQRGTICFQVMTFESEYVVTDLNFRPGAGTALTISTGIDPIAAAFACRWLQPYESFLSIRLPHNGVYVTRQYAEFVMPNEL